MQNHGQNSGHHQVRDIADEATEEQSATGETGYGARWRREPTARVGCEEGVLLIRWKGDVDPPQWYYDPFQRSEVHEQFYSLVTPNGGKEDHLLSVANQNGCLVTFENRTGPSGRLPTRITGTDGNLNLYCLDWPLCARQCVCLCREVEGAVLNLIQPSQSALPKVEKFVQSWGLPEVDLSEVSRPVYPVLRLLHLAYEMRYALELLYALKQGNFREILRAGNLLRFLKVYGPRELVAGDVAEGTGYDTGAFAPLHAYPPAVKSSRDGLCYLWAVNLLRDVFWLRLKTARPWIDVAFDQRAKSVLLSPSWHWPDLLSAMWAKVHSLMTDRSGGAKLEACPGCNMPFYTDRPNRKYPRGHESTCGKRVQRAKQRKAKKTWRGSTAKTRRKAKTKADQSVAVGRRKSKPDARI
jgi:hypothetical protein